MHDYSAQFALAKKHKAIGIMSCYPVSLAVLKTPAEMGADIAVGEGQSLGPAAFIRRALPGVHGPWPKSLIRTMPGRIVGRAYDHDGREGYCLTLQTREQHIRREKATSNICSNEALCALAALVYMSLMGKQGLAELCRLNMARAAYAMDRLTAIKGVELVDGGPWFNEFRVKLPIDARVAASRMIDKGMAAGFPLGRYYQGQENNLLVAVTEKRTKEEIGYFAEALEAVL